MDKTWEVYLYRPVALLLFHPFVSFLFLYSWEKKDTRIVCQPTRKAAKTVIRSISCSLQLRLKSNESKKSGDKMLKWTFGYYNFFTPSKRDLHSRKCSFHSSFDLSGLAQSTPQHDKQNNGNSVRCLWHTTVKIRLGLFFSVGTNCKARQ